MTKAEKIVQKSPFMDAEECAAYLKISKSTLYQLSSEGKVPSRKHATKLVFHQGDVDAWSESQRKTLDPVYESKFQSARNRIRALTNSYVNTMPAGLVQSKG